MRRRPAAAKPTAPVVSPLTERIGALLRRAQPFAYCDACLAQYFAVSVLQAERAARRVGDMEGFLRRTRRCRNCQELVEVTWRVRPVSTFLFWGRAARGA
jgi:hypothetical protein